MKRKSSTLLLATVLGGSVMFSSCIGSFGLTNKLLAWNQTIDSKFVNELVFIAFCIVPVYPISAMADLIVINSIEFWSGENPVADTGKVKTIEGKDGIYTVETKADGYQIKKEGDDKTVDLIFDKADKTWSVESNGETAKLLKFTEDDKVVMYLPDGKEMNVELNQAGVLAFRQIADNYNFFAAR